MAQFLRKLKASLHHFVASTPDQTRAAETMMDAPMVVEELEPRILHSADFSPAVVAGDALAAQMESRTLDAEAVPAAPAPTDQTEQSRTLELVFIDTATPDYQLLLDDIAAQSANQRLEVILLDADSDGVGQITDTLATRTDVSAIHIISHGSDGAVNLGQSVLDSSFIEQNEDEIANWSASLTQDADLLIYGCEVAQSDAGHDLLQRLSTLTGADVAASDDLTGATARGGDWVLEYSNGTIETSLPFTQQALEQWSGLLAPIAVDTTNDMVDGATGSIAALQATPGADGKISLREAIIAANADAGADTIILGAGTYTLSLTGTGDDAASSGDLDITDALTIIGAGADKTIIDGASADRVFHLLGSSATITGVTVTNGNAGTGGGVLIDSTSTLTLQDSAVSLNTAANAGGISVAGTLILERATIERNDANWGGGIYVWGGGSATITNATLSANTANNGGAIVTEDAITVTSSTIASNAANNNGGIRLFGIGSATLSNTILASNGGGNASGALTSLGNNIDSGNTAALVGAGDQINTDPLLGSLQYNGGTLKTMALLAGSTAIDAGNNGSAPVTDMRGFTRNGVSDIGAYEYLGASPPILTALPDAYIVNEDTLLDSTVDPWFDNGWLYRRALAFDNTAQTGNMTDFPVLVTLDSTRIDYTKTENNGEDLRFVDGDGTTLAHEIENWDESGTSTVWVKVPQIDSGSNTDFIWMYYGKSGATDAQAAENVWDASHKAVWHLNETTGDQADSTSNNHDATPFNGVSQGVTGKLDGAGGFDGTDDHLRVTGPDDALRIRGDVTLEAWVNIDSHPASGYAAIVEFAAGGESPPTNYLYSMSLRPGGDINLGHESGVGTDHFQDMGVSLNTGQWYQLTAVRDTGANEWNLYIDGALAATSPYTAEATGGNAGDIYIGWDNAHFDGKIDEIRVSDTARSADWIRAQHTATTDSYITYSYEQTVAGVLGNDFDSDGDTLTAVLVNGPANADSFTLNSDGSFDYTPTADFSGKDTFTYMANDGSADSQLVIATITVAPVNDAPTLTAPASISVTEDVAGAITGITLSDVDAGGLDVEATFTVPQGTLAATSGGGVVVGGTATSLTLTGSVADINTFITASNLTYTNVLSDTSAVTLGVSVNDLGNTGSGGAQSSGVSNVTLNVLAVNDAPTVDLNTLSAGNDHSFVFAEGDAATPIVNAASFSVADVDDATLVRLNLQTGGIVDGAAEQLTIGSLTFALDALDFTDIAVTIGPDAYTVDWVNATGAITLTLNSGEMTIAQANAALLATSYQNTNSDTPTAGARTIAVTANDGEFDSPVATSIITVAPVNDALTLTAPAAIGVTEDVAGAITGITVSDVDAGGLDVEATFTVAQGTLAATSGGGVVVGGSATSLTLTGSVADINTFITASNLTYTTVLNDTSAVTLGVSVNDLGNTGSGGAQSSGVSNVTLNVLAVNDAPTVDLNTISAGNDHSFVFAEGDAATPIVNAASFSVADVDDATLVRLNLQTGGIVDGAAEQLTIGSLTFALDALDFTDIAVTIGPDAYTVDWVNATGAITLTLNSGEMTIAQANAALLATSYQNTNSDTPTAGARTIAVTANDGELDSPVATSIITVAPVNDAPTLTVPASIGVTEDVAGAITGITVSDVDAAGANVVATFAVPQGTLAATSGGGVVVGGSATSLTLTGSVADINTFITASNLTYTTVLSDTSSVTLGVSVNDLGNTGSGGAQSSAVSNVTLNVSAVNDAPTLTAPASISVTEDVAGAITGITVSDVDAAGANVVATFAVPQGTLAATSGGGVVVGGSATSLTLTGSVADINTFITASNLTYTTVLSDTSSVTLGVSVNDQGNTGSGGAQSSAVSNVTLNVSAVNDAPTLTVPASISVTEDVAGAITGITLSDVDAGGLDVEATFTVPQGTLAATSGGGVVVGGSATSLTLTGSVADINTFITASNLTYTTVLNDTSAVTLGVSVNDLGNTGSGGAQSSAVSNVTLNVSAVNDAPINSVPGPQATDEDTALEFSSTNGNLISISDVDAGNNLVEITLTATNGTLTLNQWIGTELQGNTTTAGNQKDAAIAMDDAGNYVLVWESDGQDGDEGGIYAQRYDASGAKLGGELQVNTTTAGDQKHASVAMDADGDFVVVWQSIGQDGDQGGIYAQRYDTTGSKKGGEIQVNSTTAGDQKRASVAMDADGDFVVVWEGPDAINGDIFAQRFNAIGAKLGGEFQVNTTTAGDQGKAAVAMDADGDFVVAWEGPDAINDGIYAQRFDAGGTKQGGEFQVDTTTANDNDDVAVAMDADGDFVVVWESHDGKDTNVYAQRFDTGGTKQGGEFQVNTTTAGKHDDPVIAMDADGDFVVAWEGPDADKKGIYAQAFNASGIKQGGELQVNSTTAGEQTKAAVAMDADGDLVVAWQSPDGNQNGILTGKSLDFSFSAGSAIGATNMTFTGTVADINVALQDLVFDPTPGYSGPASVQVSVNDQGNTGGAAQTDTDLINITVNAVNDAPTLTAPAAIGVTEDVAGAITGITLSDVDAGGLDVEATFTVAQGTLAATSGGGVVVGGTATSLTLTGSVADINTFITASNLTYINALNDTSAVTLGVSVNDLGNTGSGGAQSSAVSNVTLNVNAVNDAPTLTAPASISVTEDVAGAITGITLSDVDAGGLDVEATFTVAQGTLAATSGGGVVVGGTATSLTLTGSVADINTFITASNLTYTTVLSDTSAVTLGVSVNDQGNTGSGGAQSSGVSNVTLNISAVNDAPGLTTPANIAVTEDVASAINGITVTDVDAGGANVVATFVVPKGTLAATSGGGIVVGGTATSLTLTGSVADINTFITASNLTYTSALNDTSAVNLAVSINDQGNTGSGGAQSSGVNNVTLNVSAVNDAPTLTAPASISVTEDVAGAITGITLSDVDAGGLDVEATFTVPQGTLAATSGGGVVVGGSATSLTLTGSVADINTFITASNLTYTTVLSDTSAVTLGVSVNDQGNTGSGGAQSSAVSNVTLNVSAVNDAPTLTAPASISVTEDVASAITGITVTDVDAGGANVVATFVVPKGTLAATSGGGIVVGGTATSLTLTGSVADINTFITASNLTYTSALNDTSAVNLAVSINDQGNTGSGGAQSSGVNNVTLNVSAVNDAPTLTAPASISVTEDVAGAITGITLSDEDAGGLDVEATFTVPQGTLAATSGGGVVVGGSATSLTLTGSVADINTFITASNLTYTTVLSDTSAVTLGVSVNDQGNTGSGGAQSSAVSNVTLNVSAVNDAPTLTAPASISVTEDVASAITGITVTDVDAGGANVVATFVVPKGTLAATSGGGIVVGGTATSLTLTGSVADINTFITASNLTYTSALNDTSAVNLAVSINDQGNTGSGGAQSSGVNNVTLNVSAVNDTPTASTPVSIGIITNVASTITGISFNDIDAGGANVTATFNVPQGTLSALSSGGVVVGGSATSLTLTGSITDINTYIAASNLSYTTALNDSSAINLAVTVNDLGNSGSGGAQTSIVSNVILDTPVNDAPTLTAPGSIGVTEDVASAVTGITFTDVDAGIASVVATFTVPQGALTASSSGGVVVAGSATTLTLTGSVANINSFIAGSNLTYTSVLNDTSAVALGVSINDQGNSGSGGPLSSGVSNVTLTVNAVNDAPGLTAPATIGVTEDVASVITGVSVSDVDAGGANVVATFAVPQGTLAATSGGGVIVGGSATSLTLTGSVADINTFIAASNLTYTTVLNDTSAVTLGVSVNDQGNTGSGGPLSSAISNVTLTVTGTNDLPTGSVNIAGIPTENQVLSASNALSDIDGMGTISYQWQRNGSNIPGATAGTYTLRAADVGTTISVVASYTDGNGTFESVSSAGTGLIAAYFEPTDPGTGGPPAPPGPTDSSSNDSDDSDSDKADIPPPEATPGFGSGGRTISLESVLTGGGSNFEPVVRDRATNFEADATGNSSAGGRGYDVRFFALEGSGLNTGGLTVLVTPPTSLASFDSGMRALESSAFVEELDNLRETLDSQANSNDALVASSTAASVGLSVGYLFWLMRAEVLLGTLLSSLPAWRGVDPLPVLGQLAEEGDEDEDDESLESLVDRGNHASRDAVVEDIEAV